MQFKGDLLLLDWMIILSFVLADFLWFLTKFNPMKILFLTRRLQLFKQLIFRNNFFIMLTGRYRLQLPFLFIKSVGLLCLKFIYSYPIGWVNKQTWISCLLFEAIKSVSLFIFLVLLKNLLDFCDWLLLLSHILFYLKLLPNNLFLLIS